jgi:glyoxylase-like metal-dependent hydrolase (beta-lactamase superfamily II)
MLTQDPPVEIVEDFWMLGSLPYPLFLYRGSPSGTIFEGATGAMGPLLRDQIEELGIASAAVGQLVVTHAHPDHVMAVPLLKQMFPGVEVLASKAAQNTLSIEKAIAFFSKIDDALTASLQKAGYISEEHRRPPLDENRIGVDRIIAEGDRVEVDDGVAFDVLETPGHSDCSLSFFEPGRKVLLLADATGYYLPEHDYWWPNYFTSYEVYMQSMERLAGLGAEVLCLSHNAMFLGADEVADYFQRAIDATKQYHERIVDEVKAGKDPREMAEALGAEVHEKKPLLPLDFFQKNCGLLVKLSLQHEGIS